MEEQDLKFMWPNFNDIQNIYTAKSIRPQGKAMKNKEHFQLSSTENRKCDRFSVYQ